jgi:transcriptional regulator with XRE-family HTH domain
MTTNAQRIGRRLLEARLVLGLSQRAVAGMLDNVPHQTYSRWERGLSVPPQKHLQALSGALKVSLDLYPYQDFGPEGLRLPVVTPSMLMTGSFSTTETILIPSAVLCDKEVLEPCKHRDAFAWISDGDLLNSICAIRDGYVCVMGPVDDPCFVPLNIPVLARIGNGRPGLYVFDEKGEGLFYWNDVSNYNEVDRAQVRIFAHAISTMGMRKVFRTGHAPVHKGLLMFSDKVYQIHMLDGSGVRLAPIPKSHGGDGVSPCMPEFDNDGALLAYRVGAIVTMEDGPAGRRGENTETRLVCRIAATRVLDMPNYDVGYPNPIFDPVEDAVEILCTDGWQWNGITFTDFVPLCGRFIYIGSLTSVVLNRLNMSEGQYGRKARMERHGLGTGEFKKGLHGVKKPDPEWDLL